MPRVLDIRGKLSILMLSISGGPASATGRSRARERRRDAATAGASERERATGGHIWSRGPRGSQVTLASDGASRFHDDVLTHALSSLYLGVSSLSLPHRSPPSLAVSLVPGHQKYRRLFRGWERDEAGPEDECRREALFRDYRGLSAFWNRADRLHSRYRACLQFHESSSRHDFYEISGYYPVARILVEFRSWDCRSQFVDCKSQRLYLLFSNGPLSLGKFSRKREN